MGECGRTSSSLGGGGKVSRSKVLAFCNIRGARPLGGGGSSVGGAVAPEIEGVFAVGGRSSKTVDCLFLLSSSASSAISIRRRLRKELVEEDVDPEAVCREHAAERDVSRSSLAFVMGKTVS